MSKDSAFTADFSTKVLANVVSNETDVKLVVSKVDLGEADAGIVYVTDASAHRTLKTIEIPSTDNVVAKYPIAALEKAPNPDLAAAFVAYVLSADGQASHEEMGIHPRYSLTREPAEPFYSMDNGDGRPGWVFILPSLVLLALLGLPIIAVFWKSINKNFFTYALAPTALSALRLSLLTSTPFHPAGDGGRDAAGLHPGALEIPWEDRP